MSEIKPALTPEEWKQAHETPEGLYVQAVPVYLFTPIDEDGEPIREHSERLSRIKHERRHEIAALCLLEQPFGFTWEDEQLLRVVMEHVQHEEWGESWVDDLTDLADRIEALLPPRDDA